jgi:hypothetical protein
MRQRCRYTFCALASGRGLTRAIFAFGTVLTCALAATASHASSISFAQFSETSPGGNLFKYVDNGAGQDSQFGTSTGGALGAAIPINFTFLTVGGTLPADLMGNQAATLSMTSSSKSSVATFGGLFGTQQITGGGAVSDSISITRNTPAAEGTGTRTNLLTVTFTGQLLGALNGKTPQLSSDTGLGFTLSYTSDFLTFDNNAKDFSMTFSSWTSLLDSGGLETALSGFFNSATASGAGTFDGGTTAVPEPSTWLLAAMGLMTVLAVQVVRRQPMPAKVRVRR